MKIIKYKFLSAEINHGTEEEPNIERVFLDVIMPYTESTEEIAKKEAYNGEYEIVDDGQPEADATPTLEDRVGTLESDSAETREALELLLSGVSE